jgi:hypothetical protein
MHQTQANVSLPKETATRGNGFAQNPQKLQPWEIALATAQSAALKRTAQATSLRRREAKPQDVPSLAAVNYS